MSFLSPAGHQPCLSAGGGPCCVCPVSRRAASPAAEDDVPCGSVLRQAPGHAWAGAVRGGRALPCRGGRRAQRTGPETRASPCAHVAAGRQSRVPPPAWATSHAHWTGGPAGLPGCACPQVGGRPVHGRGRWPGVTRCLGSFSPSPRQGHPVHDSWEGAEGRPLRCPPWATEGPRPPLTWVASVPGVLETCLFPRPVCRPGGVGQGSRASRARVRAPQAGAATAVLALTTLLPRRPPVRPCGRSASGPGRGPACSAGVRSTWHTWAWLGRRAAQAGAPVRARPRRPSARWA